MLPRVQAGRRDMERAADALATRLPEPLGVFARLAYNYRWSWTPGGPDVFRAIDPDRWDRVAENPIRLLQETAADRLAAAAEDADLLARASALEQTIAADLARAGAGRRRHAGASRRVLLRRVRRPRVAADLLRRPRRARGRLPEGVLGPGAADGRRRAAVPRGLLPPADRPRRLAARVLGRHRSRSGCPRRSCAARTASRSRSPRRSAMRRSRRRSGGSTSAASRCSCSTPTGRRTPSPAAGSRPSSTSPTRTCAWRSTSCSASAARRRSRRSAIEPGIVHLNEGHAAFVDARDGAAGVQRHRLAARRARDRARDAPSSRRTRRSPPATTRTPPARSPRCSRRRRRARRRRRRDRRARAHEPRRGRRAVRRDAVRAADVAHGQRRSAAATARSRARCGRRCGPDRAVDDVPITLRHQRRPPADLARASRCASCSTRTSATDWLDRADRPATWDGVDAIPDAELWAARREQRAQLIDYIRHRATVDRLQRDEPRAYAEAAARFDPDVLTIGFARRAGDLQAADLLLQDVDRAVNAGRRRPADPGAAGRQGAPARRPGQGARPGPVPHEGGARTSPTASPTWTTTTCGWRPASCAAATSGSTSRARRWRPPARRA